MKIWRLKSGEDRRFRGGHPWVYSNELAESPKGIEPGQPIELHDAGGKLLARGYGNPSSLIAFRSLSRSPEVTEPLSARAIAATLHRARETRVTAGLSEVSYRLCFGEADQLPGLIVDRYLLSQGAQIFVIQAHTAGMDRALPAILEALEILSGKDWKHTAVVLRNDINIRKLEGLESLSPQVLRSPASFDSSLDLSLARIRVPGPLGTPVEFQTDLIEGQKTGFFLDQAANIQLASQRLMGLRHQTPDSPLKILDLCCYVGQWSAKLSQTFKMQGIPTDVLAVDASAKALEFAKRNIESQGARCTTLKADVLEGLVSLPPQSFDLIVCDPPALIKSRKDIPAGTHAYLQLNTQVFRLIRPGGGVVSCSCSALMEEESFLKVLSKAAFRNRRSVRWLARGCQGPDHPMLAEFPEGHYLKCWIGTADCT